MINQLDMLAITVHLFWESLGTAAEDSEEFVKLYKNLLQDNRSFMIFHKIIEDQKFHTTL